MKYGNNKTLLGTKKKLSSHERYAETLNEYQQFKETNLKRLFTVLFQLNGILKKTKDCQMLETRGNTNRQSPEDF